MKLSASRTVTALLCLGLAYVALAAGSAGPMHQDEHVILLNDDTFDDFVSSNPLAIVEFFAPWCGHCKTLAPEYDAAAGELKDKIPFAKVDATVSEKTAVKFQIQGYPTLFLFKNGVHLPYKGGRERSEIVSYMKKQLLPAVSIVQTEEEYNSITNENEIVAVITVAQDSADYAVLSQIAANLRDEVRFVSVESADILSKYEGVSGAKFFLSRHFDETIVTFQGEIEPIEVQQFITKNQFPLLAEFTQNRIQQYAELGRPLGFLFTGKDGEEASQETNAAMEAVRAVAATYQSKIYFTYLNSNVYSHFAPMLGLTGKVFPCIGIQRNDGSIFAYDETSPIDADHVNAWVGGVLDGSTLPSIRSEPIPENNDGPVLTVVGKTFEELVLREPRDVFIKLYAPWCGHCKQMAPAWVQLAEHYAESNNIVIAEMDASVNDLSGPEPRLSGYPTLRLYRASNKMVPVPYDGNKREFEDFVKFVERYAGKSAAGDESPHSARRMKGKNV